jgi:DNA repair protein RecO (recombination protein O)
MLTKCRAIVIKCIDYSETSVILKCFTDACGMQSYLINGVRKNKGSIRPSQLQPLSLLELEAYHQQNKNLQRIKELKCAPQLSNLHFNMHKSAIGMFMAEVVYRSIKEDNQPDNNLFEYLYNTIQILDVEQERTANFPLFFMVNLTRFLGFYPKLNSSGTTTMGFNFKDGEFEPYDDKSPFQIDLACSQLLIEFMRCTYNEQKLLQIHGHHRKQLISAMVMYYNQHLNGFSNMRSHEILAEVLE